MINLENIWRKLWKFINSRLTFFKCSNIKCMRKNVVYSINYISIKEYNILVKRHLFLKGE